MKNKKKSTTEKQHTAIVWLAIACFVLLVLAATFLTMFVIHYNTANDHANSLEAGYQKSYFNLVDNINNAETEMSKALLSSDDEYIGELLQKIAKNAHNAQCSLSMLPVSANGISESLTFINQLGGYSETLSKKIIKGDALTASEKETLQELYNSLREMKISLNNVSMNMRDEYSILENSLSIKEDYNDFTINLQTIKTADVEYPTMIYDGPFSDSEITKEIKAFKNSTNEVDENQAKDVVVNLFDNANEITYMGETTSNFETYDFTFKTQSQSEHFVQISKLEGKLITLAGYLTYDKEPLFSVEDAKMLAIEFIQKTGIDNVECVWFDVIGNSAYFNFAPVIDGIILYPDLVKVKSSLVDGEILGYEAKSYYLNHDKRTIPAFTITKEQASKKIKSGYEIIGVKTVLAPIEYQEILCYEFECNFNDSTYYIYINGVTGSVANILKVIETTDGSKIM